MPSQPVHRMTDDRVTFPDEAQHQFELATLHILARGFVQKHAICGKALKLPAFVLLKGAYAHIADELPLRRVFCLECCISFCGLRHAP